MAADASGEDTSATAGNGRTAGPTPPDWTLAGRRAYLDAMPYDGATASALLRAELSRMGLTQAWLARQMGQHHRTIRRWCNNERPVPHYVAFVLHLLQQLHDIDARAEEAHVEWLLSLLQTDTKPTDTSEAHVAWLLNLIVHGTDLAAEAPVSRVIAARSPYLKRRRKSKPR